MTPVRLKTLLVSLAALLALAFPAGAAAKAKDTDRDRMPDRWERKHRLSVKKNDARADRDRDGLRNLAEYRAKTNPRKADSDRDGVLDGDEDRDRDRVDNANEDREGTHPGKKDSDGDGVRDCDEDADRDKLDNEGEDVTGMDPVDPDSDDDGVKDGDEDAGRVESFVDGVLTIRLPSGKTLEGEVTDQTEIECKPEDAHEDWGDDDVPVDDPKLPATPPTGDEGDDDSRNTLDVVGRERRVSDPFGAGERSGPGGGDEDDAEDLLDDWDDDYEAPVGEWEDEDEEYEEDCGVEALVPGAVVHEAELSLTGDGALFSKIELVK